MHACMQGPTALTQGYAYVAWRMALLGFNTIRLPFSFQARAPLHALPPPVACIAHDLIRVSSAGLAGAIMHAGSKVCFKEVYRAQSGALSSETVYIKVAEGQAPGCSLVAQVLLNLEAVSWTAACQRTSPGALMASVTPPGLTVPSSAQDYGFAWVRACLGRNHSHTLPCSTAPSAFKLVPSSKRE